MAERALAAGMQASRRLPYHCASCLCTGSGVSRALPWPHFVSSLLLFLTHPSHLLSPFSLHLQGSEDYLGVLLARADCLRRQLPDDATAAAASPIAAALRAWFGRSAAVMTQYFPDVQDVSLRLLGYAAHVYGLRLADLEGMRSVWEESVKGPLGRCGVTGRKKQGRGQRRECVGGLWV
jgi:hypothetical protein